MSTMLPLLVLLLGLSLPQPGPPPSAQRGAPWSASPDLEILDDERDSLRGVTRLALSVNVPESLRETVPAAPLQSMLTFLLDQAGIVVLQRRELEDPVLAVTVNVVADQDERGTSTGWVAYQVYADLLQLVRLSDHDGKARIMLASTWHAGSHGIAPVGEEGQLQTRVRDVIDAFLIDYRGANSPPPTPSPRLIR